jgi:hypothetical protein
VWSPGCLSGGGLSAVPYAQTPCMIYKQVARTTMGRLLSYRQVSML